METLFCVLIDGNVYNGQCGVRTYKTYDSAYKNTRRYARNSRTVEIVEMAVINVTDASHKEDE